jgi:hypothetical protein
LSVVSTVQTSNLEFIHDDITHTLKSDLGKIFFIPYVFIGFIVVVYSYS